ncbi:MAG TPA: AMP-binding protein [Clostridia bacterium]|nr:AMP-binding protein [Clostridia bacterium]
MSSKSLYEVRFIRDFRDLLGQSAQLFPEKAAFWVRVESGEFRSITYRHFKEDVDALGAALRSLGLNGGFVSVMGENRYEWCVSYLAVTNHVGVIVPMDKELPLAEKGNLINRSGSSALIFSGRLTNDMLALKKSGSQVKYFISMDQEEDSDDFLSFRKLLEKGRLLLEQGKADLDGYKIDDTAMSILLFTSGTTDLAKGVMLSQKNICSDIMSVSKTVRVDSNDITLSILPLHHTYECSLDFLTIIYSGATIAFNEGLKYIQKNLGEVRPTILVTVPLLLENLYKKIWNQIRKKPGMKFVVVAMLLISEILKFFHIDVRRALFGSIHRTLGGRLRLFITGAAAIDRVVANGLDRFGFKVLQGYGLTECSPLVIGERDNFHGNASVGLPIPGVEVRIDNPDENGVGEIITKGDNVMLGYYKNEEATAKCLRDGWFHTGDLGKISRSGAYYITGRLKNVIVTKNGKNIFPEEVESYINRSPYVLESMVTGYEDDKSGETMVGAHILPNLDAIKEKLKGHAPSMEEIRSIISEVVKNTNRDMPLYKRISAFTIRESDFIKTTTMKIKRYAENAQMKLKKN